MSISVLSAPTEPNVNALVWKMAYGITKMQKISNRINMLIFNKLRRWFSKSVQSLAPMNVHHKYEMI